MKHLVPLALVLLAGCQSAPQLTPHISHPARSLATTPSVEFMGDSQIMQMVTYADNPMWQCTTCVADQLSDAVLAEVPEVIAIHPDIVVIQTGAYDLEVDPTQRDPPLAVNVKTMVEQFEAANIPVLVCLLPAPDPATIYDPFYFDEAMDYWNEAGLIPYLFPQSLTENDLLDGIQYTQDALTVVKPFLQEDVNSFDVGGVK